MVFCCIGVSRKFSFKARLEAASPISGAPVEMSAVLWIDASKRDSRKPLPIRLAYTPGLGSAKIVHSKGDFLSVFAHRSIGARAQRAGSCRTGMHGWSQSTLAENL